MKTIRIAALDIANRHPLGLKCQTDSTYARFATELAELLAKQNIQGFEGHNVKELAIVLTMYYEDVLSDLGMWYSFTERMHQLYGRYLPFFDVDEKQYYRDEPNNVDIRFLIWLFISRTEPGYIVSPDTLAVEYASEVVGELMDRKFEEMPVNEELKEYFAHPAFENVFTMQRDAQKWFFFTNYLTCNEHAMGITMQQGMRFSRNMNCPPQLALRVSECVAVYENKLQPLALRPNEWLGMLLEYNGAKEEAARVKEQEYLPFDFYMIVEAEHGKGFTLETLEGKKFHVTDEDMGMPSDDCYSSKTVLSFFVKYGDRYYLGTESSWAPDTKAFDEERKSREAQRNQSKDEREKLIADNGGSPLFYFANADKMKSFLKDTVKMPAQRVETLQLPKEQNITFTLFVRERDLNICFYPEVAKFIKDDKNPYYDAEFAKTNTFAQLFGMDGDMVRYLVGNDMLPEATINCEGGEEAGKKIVHDNFDFLSRMMQGNLY